MSVIQQHSSGKSSKTNNDWRLNTPIYLYMLLRKTPHITKTSVCNITITYNNIIY